LVELGAATAERLRQACADEGVTPYMVLLAAFATLLYRETGQDDILFGGPSSNRTRPEDEGVIGFFANTLVTRVQLAGNPTFRELLDRVRQSVLEAIEHEELPLDRVVEAIAPPRLAGVNPLFQVNFRTRVGTLPTLELAGATTAPVELELGLARFDLAFEAHVRDDGISGEFLYATALFDRARIERLAAAFESLLDAALADPARRLLAFDLPEEPSAAQSRPRIQGFRGTRRGASSGSRSRRPPAEPRR
jgi:non-ribosomal peptide synthetase component F